MVDRRSIALGSVLVAGGAAFAALVTNPAVLDYGVLTAYFILLAGSWNLLAGFTGQFSFAHMGFAALGAYLSILLNQALGIPVGPSLAFAGLLTAVAGLGLGIVSMRVRGVYLSFVTFAFAGAFQVLVIGWYSLTHGALGRTAEVLFTGISRTPFVWLGLALVVAFYVCQRLVLESRLGIQAMAIREREEVAEGLGVRTRRVKVTIFVITSFWAGVAGAFYAGYEGFVDPNIGSLTNMGLVVAMVVIGGIGTRAGPIFGAILLQIVTYFVASRGAEYTLMIFSAALLVIMLTARDGLVPLVEANATRLLRAATRWKRVEAVSEERH